MNGDIFNNCEIIGMIGCNIEMLFQVLVMIFNMVLFFSPI